MKMQGKRVYAQNNDLWLKPGEYGIQPRDGIWYAVTPSGHWGNLANHEVTEHEDGTITVSPSILVTGYDDEKREKETWHGYLERGVWREV
jgi:hypothetical protein